ncbi:MAG: tRNA (adenosine(37)-N6)-threonylcarbamoyltransferase complex ATPase subunit type 1 TsaE [Clostridia bacterium]|nr:tRNA (adenosine(37)-N6)-threonylcarbamoyltransferase complex ATPase subunit type 1 TsaE [Clostridia bacterium]
MNGFDKILQAYGKDTANTVTLFTESCAQTEQFGAALARIYQSAECSLPPYIALRGDLGVGKTAFVRGFVSLLAPDAAVRSPTFALVNEYRPRIKNTPVFHFDMYRIVDEDDLYSIGYDDYLERGICIVEWSENIPYALPDDYLRLTIEKTSPDIPDQRKLTLERIN